MVRGKFPTSISMILVKPTGDRTVVNARIGTPCLTVGQVDFSRCSPQVILFDGHEPVISRPLAESARERGIITVLDAGSVHQGTLALLPLVDYLVASERFARDFSGQDDLEKAFHALKRQAPSVVVTLGEQGLEGRNGSNEGRLPAFPIEAVDTTGAEIPSWRFCARAARGASFVSALVFASAAAALSCRSLGARPGIPTRREVQEFLSQQRALPILSL